MGMKLINDDCLKAMDKLFRKITFSGPGTAKEK